jgi:hypothetical protein
MTLRHTCDVRESDDLEVSQDAELFAAFLPAVFSEHFYPSLGTVKNFSNNVFENVYNQRRRRETLRARRYRLTSRRVEA